MGTDTQLLLQAVLQDIPAQLFTCSLGGFSSPSVRVAESHLVEILFMG